VNLIERRKNREKKREEHDTQLTLEYSRDYSYISTKVKFKLT